MEIPKRKNQWLTFEDIKEKEVYKFDFNPLLQPEFEEKTVTIRIAKYRKNLIDWRTTMYKMLYSYSDIVELTLVPECSPQSRFHFHGYIKVLNLQLFPLFIQFINEAGSSEMDTIEDESIWHNYIYKQSSIWEKYMKSCNYLLVTKSGVEEEPKQKDLNGVVGTTQFD